MKQTRSEKNCRIPRVALPSPCNNFNFLLAFLISYSCLSRMEHNPWLHCGSINVNLVANECRRKKISAMKVIRVCDINQFEEIVTKHGVDLKVIGNSHETFDI